MNWPSLKLFVCAAVVLIFASNQWLIAQQDVKKITEVEGITEYQLENGVQVLLFPDLSKPRVTVNMTVLVGSRHEGYGETGMAHLLEHMLFKGTPTHQDIPTLLKDRGVLNMNGTTWYDRTNYYETLPSSDENLEFAIKMEADRLLNSMIRAEDLASEMTVVRNEFERGENSPDRILFQRIMANAYEWHNYGKSTIGNRSDIERVPVTNLRQFYRKFYQPDNIMVVVAGNFDDKKALEYLNKYFGKLEYPQRELSNTYTEEPAQDGERLVVLRRVGDTQLVGVGYHVTSAADKDYAACQVLGEILGTEPSGPLYKSLVETQIASSVSTMDISGHDPGMLLAFAEVPISGDIEKAKTTMLAEIEKIGKDGVDDELVKRAVQKILKDRETQFANSESFAINLSEWRAYGDWRLYFLHRDRLEKVTAADVQRVASAFCIPSNRTVGLFIPTDSPVRSPVPTMPNLNEALADYKGRAKIAEGEAFDPTPDTIQQRTTFGKLDSGIKYAMLPKKTRGERVFVRGELEYGNLDSLKGKVAAAQILPEMLSRGTKHLSFQQYKDRLDELKANVAFGGEPGELTISIQTKNEFFDETMDVVRQALREPALEESELEIVKRQLITQMESMKSEPQALAATEIRRRLDPYPTDDVRYTPTIDEGIQQIEAVTIDDIKNLYNDFLNGEHGQIAVVGDFDLPSTVGKLNSMFNNWKSDIRYVRIESPAIPGITGDRISINTPDKKNAVYIAGLTAPIRDDNDDYESLLIGDYILGGGPLSSRLADRVRKKEGLSYGVGSNFQASSKDDKAMFMMFAISNPENTEKVVTTIDQELTRLLESGVTGDELEKAKESYLKNRQGGRAQEGRLASLLLDNLATDRTMEFQKSSDDRISGLSKEQVDGALRRHIKKEDLMIITAGDFEANKAVEQDIDEGNPR